MLWSSYQVEKQTQAVDVLEHHVLLITQLITIQTPYIVDKVAMIRFYRAATLLYSTPFFPTVSSSSKKPTHFSLHMQLWSEAE